jgi:hypothetical protein
MDTVDPVIIAVVNYESPLSVGRSERTRPLFEHKSRRAVASCRQTGIVRAVRRRSRAWDNVTA